MCDGVRDPAVYLRRSELATPKAFDQDFNFLSGVERSREQVERSLASRGIHVRDQVPVKGYQAKGEVPLRNTLEKCGVIIEKAPPFMQRHCNNRTRWSKK